MSTGRSQHSFEQTQGQNADIRQGGLGVGKSAGQKISTEQQGQSFLPSKGKDAFPGKTAGDQLHQASQQGELRKSNIRE